MELKQPIATHLDTTRESYPTWVRQPFTFAVETADVNDEYLDEIIETQQSKVQQQLFRTTMLSTFWCRQMEKYPVIAKKALEFFYTICYNISLRAILFEDAGHKNEE